MQEVKSNGLVKCIRNKMYLEEKIWIEIKKTSNLLKKTSKLLNPKRRLFSVVRFFSNSIEVISR